MSCIGRDGDKGASGNSHTIGKCERAQRETCHGNLEDVESESASRIWDTGEEIQRTEAKTTKPLGLPEEAVYLVHLVHSGFGPTFFSNHRVDLLAEGFNIFGIREKTIQYLRERLLIWNDQDWNPEDGMSTLAKVVE
jgi:hypothetical protein